MYFNNKKYPFLFPTFLTGWLFSLPIYHITFLLLIIISLSLSHHHHLHPSLSHTHARAHRMETIWMPLKRRWKRKGYYRLSAANRKNVTVTRFGAGNTKRSWRIKKFRFRLPSPLKLWYKFKNAYMNMMLKMAVNSGSEKTFGARRIPKARKPSLPHTNTEFENRLIYEIYKSMVTSLELGYNK